MVGTINWDVSIFEERFARPGEEVPVKMVEECPGGKGANVAVAAARILGPWKVSLLGALGDDEISDRQLADLREEGVMTEGISILTGKQSGRAYIVVERDGKKTIHTHFGANDEFFPRRILKDAFARTLSKTSMTVIVDPPIQTASFIARAAKAQGSRVIYSPGVRTKERLEGIEDIIQMADTLVLDINELKNLCNTSDEGSAISKLKKSYQGLTVVTTLGPRGSFVVEHGVRSAVKGVDLRSLGLTAVNSTGSGDAFLGAFSCFLLKGQSTVDAARWANLAGALKASKYETRGSPRKGELISRMRYLEGRRQARIPRESPDS